ncbi:MAG: hypothetical protein ABW019_16620 [Chitinophagaceae bacterium]
MKQAVIFPSLFSLLLIFACNNKPNPGQLVTVPDTSQFITVPDTSTAFPPAKAGEIPHRGMILQTENIKIVGDTTIDKDKIHYTATRFEPYISFSDFNISRIDHRSKAPLDFSSNPEARYYRTRIREGYREDSVNFAGHYTLVIWGCGAPCQAAVIIDRQTGKIYDVPTASGGYEFRVDSRLLIVNPPDEDGFYDDCPYCKPLVYIFNEKKKTFQEKKPGLE